MDDCWKEPALYVGKINDDIDLNLLPTSGEDYIKRVVIEAQRCESVVVAEIDESRLKRQTLNVNQLPGCTEAPASLRPTLHWQQCQIADFSETRLKIARSRSQIEKEANKWEHVSTVTLPEMENRRGWIELCTAEVQQESQLSSPTLGTVLSMSHPLVEQVLEYLVEFIEGEEKVSTKVGQWVYALLAVLELPLNPDACSCLRALARVCSTIRANMDPKNENCQLNTLNLFICLVARYFRQLDLADP